MSGVLAVGAFLGSLWLEQRTELTLPTPTGSFAVGRVIYDWADDAPSHKRELLVWIWYPSGAGQSAGMTDDYLPVQLRPTGDIDRAPLIFRLLTRDVSKVHGHSLRNSAMSPQQRSYPVVIMRAGASAVRGANHFMFSDDGALLKSHILLRMLRTFGILGIDGRRQLAVTAYCVHSFFDAYLKGASVSRLEISSPLYPEIEVLE